MYQGSGLAKTSHQWHNLQHFELMVQVEVEVVAALVTRIQNLSASQRRSHEEQHLYQGSGLAKTSHQWHNLQHFELMVQVEVEVVAALVTRMQNLSASQRRRHEDQHLYQGSGLAKTSHQWHNLQHFELMVQVEVEVVAALVTRMQNLSASQRRSHEDQHLYQGSGLAKTSHQWHNLQHFELMVQVEVEVVAALVTRMQNLSASQRRRHEDQHLYQGSGLAKTSHQWHNLQHFELMVQVEVEVVAALVTRIQNLSASQRRRHEDQHLYQGSGLAKTSHQWHNLQHFELMVQVEVEVVAALVTRIQNLSASQRRSHEDQHLYQGSGLAKTSHQWHNLQHFELMVQVEVEVVAALVTRIQNLSASQRRSHEDQHLYQGSGLAKTSHQWHNLQHFELMVQVEVEVVAALVTRMQNLSASQRRRHEDQHLYQGSGLAKTSHQWHNLQHFELMVQVEVEVVAALVTRIQNLSASQRRSHEDQHLYQGSGLAKTSHQWHNLQHFELMVQVEVEVVAALVTRIQNLSASQRRSHEEQHLYQGSGLAKTSHQWHNLQQFETMVQVEVEVVAALVTRMQNLSASQRRSHEDQHLYQGSGLAKTSHQWHNLQHFELMVQVEVEVVAALVTRIQNLSASQRRSHEDQHLYQGSGLAKTSHQWHNLQHFELMVQVEVEVVAALVTRMQNLSASQRRSHEDQHLYQGSGLAKTSHQWHNLQHFELMVQVEVEVVAALVTRIQNLSASQRRSHEDQHLYQGSGLAKTSHQWHNLQHFELMVQVEVEVVAALVTRMQNLSASQRRSHEDQHLYQGSGLAKTSHQWHNLQHFELMVQVEVEVVAALVTRIQNLSASQRRSHEDQHLYQGSGLAKTSHQWHNLQHFELMVQVEVEVVAALVTRIQNLSASQRRSHEDQHLYQGSGLAKTSHQWHNLQHFELMVQVEVEVVAALVTRIQNLSASQRRSHEDQHLYQGSGLAKTSHQWHNLQHFELMVQVEVEVVAALVTRIQNLSASQRRSHEDQHLYQGSGLAKTSHQWHNLQHFELMVQVEVEVVAALVTRIQNLSASQRRSHEDQHLYQGSGLAKTSHQWHNLQHFELMVQVEVEVVAALVTRIQNLSASQRRSHEDQHLYQGSGLAKTSHQWHNLQHFELMVQVEVEVVAALVTRIQNLSASQRRSHEDQHLYQGSGLAKTSHQWHNLQHFELMVQVEVEVVAALVTRIQNLSASQRRSHEDQHLYQGSGLAKTSHQWHNLQHFELMVQVEVEVVAALVTRIQNLSASQRRSHEDQHLYQGSGLAKTSHQWHNLQHFELMVQVEVEVVAALVTRIQNLSASQRRSHEDQHLYQGSGLAKTSHQWHNLQHFELMVQVEVEVVAALVTRIQNLSASQRRSHEDQHLYQGSGLAKTSHQWHNLQHFELMVQVEVEVVAALVTRIQNLSASQRRSHEDQHLYQGSGLAKTSHQWHNLQHFELMVQVEVEVVAALVTRIQNLSASQRRSHEDQHLYQGSGLAKTSHQWHNLQHFELMVQVEVEVVAALVTRIQNLSASQRRSHEDQHLYQGSGLAKTSHQWHNLQHFELMVQVEVEVVAALVTRIQNLSASQRRSHEDQHLYQGSGLAKTSHQWHNLQHFELMVQVEVEVVAALVTRIQNLSASQRRSHEDQHLYQGSGLAKTSHQWHNLQHFELMVQVEVEVVAALVTRIQNLSASQRRSHEDQHLYQGSGLAKTSHQWHNLQHFELMVQVEVEVVAALVTRIQNLSASQRRSHEDQHLYQGSGLAKTSHQWHNLQHFELMVQVEVEVVAALVTRIQNLSASQRRSHEDQHLYQGSGLAKTSHQWHNLQHFELMVQVEVEVVAALVTRMQNLSASQRRSHEDQHLYQGSGLAKTSHQWHNLQHFELMVQVEVEVVAALVTRIQNLSASQRRSHEDQHLYQGSGLAKTSHQWHNLQHFELMVQVEVEVVAALVTRIQNLSASQRRSHEDQHLYQGSGLAKTSHQWHNLQHFELMVQVEVEVVAALVTRMQNLSASQRRSHEDQHL